MHSWNRYLGSRLCASKEWKELGHPIVWGSHTKGCGKCLCENFKEDLYSKTGIQFLPFNTVFQYASEKRVLRNADKELTDSGLLAYQLTGVSGRRNKRNKQLLNPHHKRMM